jgi:signal transduction histidine kinase
MFPSLRAKLIVAFALVTFLTVLLTGIGTTLLLRNREVSAARDRVGQLGNAVAVQVVWILSNNGQPDTLANFLQQRAEELNVRFLLVDTHGLILLDTDGKLTGQPASQIPQARSQTRRPGEPTYGFTTWRGQYVVSPSVGPVFRYTPENHVLMLVPESDIAGAWRDILPRLILSGGIAMVAAIGVAYLLARSITRPVTVLTRAAGEMSQGHYDQRISVQGRDEIGRLAGTFNGMASQVARSHRTMQDLIGNVAHELKTPLTSIQGYSQALIDGLTQTPDEQAHAARVINEEADRMRRLVEDLLYLSRLESGQLRIDRAPVRVPALLQTAAERVTWQLRGTTRDLQVHLPVDLPTIQGDERRLEQVLANLLDNAVRYTPDGGRITLGARWTVDGVLITVHNTGSYIAPQQLARIFERFYQVDPARTRDGHHGGLGLAIAREIVLAHGGTLTATSDPGAGTEFQVVLPAGLARQPDDTAWRPPAARPQSPPAPRAEPGSTAATPA